MMMRNWTLVSVFATLAVASWAQPPAAPPQDKPDAPPRVQNAPNNAEIPQAVRERVRERIQQRTGRTPDVAPKANDQLVRPGQAESAPLQTRPEQTDKPDATKRPTTSLETPDAAKQPSDNARPKADAPRRETPKSTPNTSRATPRPDATPFVPQDMPERLRRNNNNDNKETPASKTTREVPAQNTGTPSSVKLPNDILPSPSNDAPGEKPAAPPTAPPSSSDKPGASKPSTTGNKPPTGEKPDSPATPAPSPIVTPKPTESPKPTQSPTPPPSPSPAAKTPVTGAPTPETAAPTPATSPAPGKPTDPEAGRPTATPSTEAGRKAAERRKDRTVISVDKANQDNLNQAAEALLGKRPRPSSPPGAKPTGAPAAPKLTPWVAPSVVTGSKEAESTGRPDRPVLVMPPAGATPTPTPAAPTIKVSDPRSILDNIKNITLAPTPPPAPTPGATPVATPPGVTPVPSNFSPKRDWVPYPGWRPQQNWKPPKGWTPPGGWTPPPGWEAPRDWVPRLRRWGWNYIPQRGWVVPVQWTPPPDFTVPPGWYYLPSAAYDDYGFYDPSEVVVMPGYARPDLRININMNQVYTPPAPPPAQVLNLPPPPPRPAPPEPPRVPDQVTDVEMVAQILTRPRDPNGPRYQGPVLVTGSVHFDFDSYAIRPDSFPTLDAVGQALVSEMPDAIINVEGHTDSKGSDEYNQNLSEQRAWSVKSYLVQKFGLDPNRLIIVGYGERAPIAENETDAGRARNRRVEFENVTDLYQAQVVETAQP